MLESNNKDHMVINANDQQEESTIMVMKKDKAFRNRVHNRKMHNKMAKESRKKNREK